MWIFPQLETGKWRWGGGYIPKWGSGDGDGDGDGDEVKIDLRPRPHLFGIDLYLYPCLHPHRGQRFFPDARQGPDEGGESPALCHPYLGLLICVYTYVWKTK